MGIRVRLIVEYISPDKCYPEWLGESSMDLHCARNAVLAALDQHKLPQLVLDNPVECTACRCKSIDLRQVDSGAAYLCVGCWRKKQRNVLRMPTGTERRRWARAYKG